MSDTISAYLDEGIGVIGLNRPKQRNALTLSLLEGIGAAVRAHVEAGTAAIVVTGMGGTFSAGIDVGEVSGSVDDLVVDAAIAAASAALREAKVPVIAAVEGACIGAAVELAMACDVRVVASDGYFRVPATRLGLLYQPASLARLRRLMGREVLARLFLLDEPVRAPDAVALGLASQVAPPGGALAAALVLAHRAERCVPAAVAETKAFLNTLDEGSPISESWEMRRQALLASEERSRAVEQLRKQLKANKVRDRQ